MSLTGTRFDPRAVLTLADAALHKWKADLLAHLTERYRGDARVLA